MKRIVIAFFPLFILMANFAAAQTISYMIPDIGSPGMNTYIEIIAPYNVTGNFGTDGFYMNNRNDNIRVEPFDLDDTSKVVFGPIVVSWNGRMISTQAFVNPHLKPRFSYWRDIPDSLKIPVRVYVNGTYTNADTFFIVKPFSLTNTTGPNTDFLGDGSLGRRSKRGAMIVDSLALGNKPYTVSRIDCDPYTQGNQGYLPFILISKGDIRGSASTAINANGEKLNGGPGGGGGGNQFCDASIGFSSIGGNGGDGFTGGGPGGRNRSTPLTGVTDVMSSPGNGTKANGSSLNDVPAPQPAAYESSGGGTGHPFGQSGFGCWTGGTCDPDGGYGGGSGYRNNLAGGSGGYGTNGSNSGSNNGGKAHGNIMSVPLAGGSGGGSGNPQASSGGCSGAAGGGGGAAMIYGRSLSGFSILANGGSGEDGEDDSWGGGGSGGFGGSLSKLGISQVSISVTGGSGGSTRTGGAGRARIDAPGTPGVTTTPAAATNYRGVTTDTNSLVLRNFTLKGSRQDGRNVRLFLKPETGSWTELSGITYSGTSWQIPVDLTGTTDSVYYISAMQDVPSPSSTDYRMEPAFVMSQASANVLRIQKLPVIDGDSIKNARITNCPGNSIRMEVMLYNRGDAELVLDFNSAGFSFGNRGFSLVDPTNQRSVNPDDSIKVTVQYTYQPGQRGIVTDTLRIAHNDIMSPKQPWTIAYNVTIDTLAIEAYDTLQPPDKIQILDLGEICVGNTITGKIYVRNESTVGISDVRVDIIDKVNFGINHTGSRNLPAWGDTSLIYVSFTPSREGTFQTILTTGFSECDDIKDTVIIRGVGIITELLAIDPISAFESTKVGQRDTVTVKIRNTGSSDAEITNLPDLDSPFNIVGVEPPLPQTLSTGEEITLTIEFAPTAEGNYDTTFKAGSLARGLSCPDSVDIMLTGIAIASKVWVSKYTIDFDTLAPCQTGLDSIIIRNDGEATFSITEQASISGDVQNFEIVTPLPDITEPLGKGDSVVYYIRFNPAIGPDGRKSAALLIKTDDAEYETITIDLQGYIESLNVAVDPATQILDFGSKPIGANGSLDIKLTNNGGLSVHVARVESDNADVSVSPQTVTITGGATETLTATMNFRTAGNISAMIRIIFDLPCPDTIVIDARGNALEGSISFNSLDFDYLAPCNSKIDIVRIKNEGDGAPVDITSLNIEGEDATLFRIVSTVPVFTSPLTLNQGDSLLVAIEFSAQGSADEFKQAKLVIGMFANGQNSIDSAALRGEVRSGIVMVPGEVDFGDIIENQTSAPRTLTLTNEGETNITITDLLPLSLSVFSVQPSDLDTILLPGEKVTFTFTFKPDAAGDYDDTLQIDMNVDGCPFTKSIALKGRGIREVPPADVVIWLPADTLANPGDDNFRIPIYIKMNNDDGNGLQNFGFETNISFNASMYLPEQLSTGTILSSTITGGLRTIRIKVDSLDISGQTSVATYIQGSALLGNNDSTYMEFTDSTWSNARDIVTTTPGLFRTTICREGGDRLVRTGIPLLPPKVNPNPSSGVISIGINALESGEHQLLLIDMKGSATLISKWTVQAGGNKEFEFKYDTGALTSGMYYMVIKSPTDSKSVPVFVIK